MSSAPPLAQSLSAQTLLAALLVLAGAWFFQLVVGLVPCELCLAERWAWYAAAGLAALFLAGPAAGARRLAPVLFGLLFLAGAGLALYHVAIEQHWILGPDACSVTGSHRPKTIEELTAEIMAAPVVRCDEVQWRFAGLSLAGWDAICCMAMVLLAWRAHRHRSLSKGSNP